MPKLGPRSTNPAERALRESLSRASALVSRKPLSDDAVHEARKALKVARAALRLLRAAIGEASFRAENAALRDAGRALAALREPASLRSALEALRERYPQELRGAPLASARRLLRARRARALGRLTGDKSALEQCLRLIERTRARVAAPAFRAAGPLEIARGLARIDARNRKAYRKARKMRTHEALHEWRKQVKYLANARTILGEASPLGPARLAERLGEDHDLHLLVLRLRLGARIEARVAKRRAKLQKRAFSLGSALYREKP